jgi:hypothetical protein
LIAAASSEQIPPRSEPRRLAPTPQPTRILRWKERGPISRKQADLIHLRRKLAEVVQREGENVPDLTQEVAELEAELGDDVLRTALPGEIVMVPQPGTNVVRAHNPSTDKVVFHVAIQGETELIGSARGSVAHEVWLAPGEAIDIPAPSWTSPATTYR